MATGAEKLHDGGYLQTECLKSRRRAPWTGAMLTSLHAVASIFSLLTESLDPPMTDPGSSDDAKTAFWA